MSIKWSLHNRGPFVNNIDRVAAFVAVEGENLLLARYNADDAWTNYCKLQNEETWNLPALMGRCPKIGKCRWSVSWEGVAGFEGRGDSVGLSVDWAALSSGRGGTGNPLLCVFWAGAVLAVVVSRRHGAGGCGWGGRGLGLLLKVCNDDCQVPDRHLQVLSTAPVDVF